MTLGKQIRKYREQLGWTLEDLENRSGVGRGTISALENRGSQRSVYAPAIAQAFGITLEQLLDPHNNWLDNQEEERPRAKGVGRPAHIHLPILEVSPAAGAGREPVDYPAVIDYLEVPEAWAKHRLGRDLSKYRVLPVSGDSMSPTINDGDLVFVDTNVTSYQTNGIYVIIWHDRLLIKRLRASLSSGKIEIASDNEAAYPTEAVSLEEVEKLHICGLVKCWWSIKGA